MCSDNVDVLEITVVSFGALALSKLVSVIVHVRRRVGNGCEAIMAVSAGCLLARNCVVY